MTAIWFTFTLALITAGCASTPARSPMASEIRAGLGRIAIADHARLREFSYDLPNPHFRQEVLSEVIAGTSTAIGGIGAAAGLGYGLAAASAPGYAMDWPGLGDAFGGVFLAGTAVGRVAGVLLTPVGASVGALHDSVLNETPGKLRSAAPVVVRTLQVVEFEEELRQRLQRNMRTQTVYQVTQAFVAESDATLHQPTLQNRYLNLRAQGFDTVIEVSAIGTFEAGIGWHNPFRLQADLWFTVVDLVQCREIYYDHFEHRSKSRRFVSWAKDDARLLKNELELCYDAFTQHMMAEIIVNSR